MSATHDAPHADAAVRAGKGGRGQASAPGAVHALAVCAAPVRCLSSACQQVTGARGLDSPWVEGWRGVSMASREREHSSGAHSRWDTRGCSVWLPLRGTWWMTCCPSAAASS